MSTHLKAGQRPPFPQVAVFSAGASAFLYRLAEHVPAAETTLRTRPRNLDTLGPSTRDGLRTSLLRLRDQIDATLEELS